MLLSGKKILIIQQRDWAIQFGHDLARQLQAEGCELAAITIKKEAEVFVLKQKEVKYTKIYTSDNLKDQPCEVSGINSVSLKEICDDLQIDTVWRLAQSVRTYVKDYTGKYYFSFNQGRTDAEIIAFIKATYIHVKQCLDEFKPDIIIGPNYAGIQHIMMNLLARSHGIKMLAPTDSKIKGISIYSRHYLSQDSRYLDRVRELNSNEDCSDNHEYARQYIAKNREKLNASSLDKTVNNPFDDNRVSKLQFFTALLNALYSSLHEMYAYYKKGKNRINKVKIVPDNRTPFFIMRDKVMPVVRRWSASELKYAEFDSSSKYIYFPLQVQPEVTIDVHAVLFNNQLETVRQVAMACPGDYSLVVKDHPNMVWRRPLSYLKKLSRIPNVRLVHYKTSSEELLRNASLVVSPSSSTISEAAILKIPAIQLGSLGTTAIYPSVTRHSDIESLPDVMNNCINSRFDDLYELKLLNCVAAAYDVGISASTNLNILRKDKVQKKGFINSFVNEIKLELADLE